MKNSSQPVHHLPKLTNLELWLNKYAKTHTHPTNKLFHYFCVPPIFFTVLALLNAVKIFSFAEYFTFSCAHILIVIAIFFYAKLSIRFTFLMTALSLTLVFLSSFAENIWGNSYLVFCAILFIGAWIGQFIGHKIEGAKPAFFDDITFLLVGPLWIIDKAFKKSE